MKRLTVIATAVILALLGFSTLDLAAQQPDTRDRTIMTFSSAVELPGMRLDPGTYVFKLADTQSRNVIQVLSEDEMKVLGQWLYVPAERQEVTGDTVVTFRETSADTTPAVQFWFYPGEKIGKEFIYPKDQAQRIAARTGQGVLTEEGRVGANDQVAAATPATAGDAASAEPAATAPAASEAEARAGVVEGTGVPDADKPAADVGVQARAETQDAPTPQPAPAPARRAEPAPQAVGTAGQAAELPATASPVPFSAVLGLLSLIGAAGIRAFRP
jgi:hypothetical protein